MHAWVYQVWLRHPGNPGAHHRGIPNAGSPLIDPPYPRLRCLHRFQCQQLVHCLPPPYQSVGIAIHQRLGNQGP
ncbi:hypothetical protein GCM10007907_33860 [Chitinimonas prasina]|uniref:Uncharacterized protein n=1 Tax=Chitinimonas prasina TaxID=1434937 RepID=A0ABQ5YMR0_9NEIS|nr:hypothetical protein GCM10007907_33860 [Chitinimonas prasina]